MEKGTGSPKIVHTLGWTAAAIAAVVFAASAGVFAYRAISQPISAKILSTTPNCADKNTFAINNYAPELQTNAGGHAKVEGLLGGSYRCSSICVPDSVPGTNPDQAAVGKYVKDNITVNGQKVNVVDTGSAFIDLANTANSTNEAQIKTQLQNTVIISSTKRNCLGASAGSTSGASVDYTNLQSNGKDIVLTPNETAKQIVAQKNEEFRIGTTSGSANSQPGAPSASDLPSAPTGKVSDSPGPIKSGAPTATGGADYTVVRSSFKVCENKLYDNLNSWLKWIYPSGDITKTATKPGWVGFYNEYNKAYTALNTQYDQPKDLAQAQTGLVLCTAIKAWANDSITSGTKGEAIKSAPTAAQAGDYATVRSSFKVCENKLYDNLNSWLKWIYPSGDITKTATKPGWVGFYNEYNKAYTDLNTQYDQPKDLAQAQKGLAWCTAIKDWANQSISSDNSAGSAGANAVAAATTALDGVKATTGAATAEVAPVPDKVVNPRSWKRTGTDVVYGLASGASTGALIGAGIGAFGGGIGAVPGALVGGSIGAIAGTVGGVITSLF